jgi:hypothetical protein
VLSHYGPEAPNSLTVRNLADYFLIAR